MKKISAYTAILAGVALTGCGGFLEEFSQDEVRPSTVGDMEKLIEGEAYHKSTDDAIFRRSVIFTDDTGCNGNDSEGLFLEKLQNDRWLFSWDRDMFNDAGPGNDPALWETPYKLIMGCNVILDYMSRVTGDRTIRDNIVGEAHALRGFYYLQLVNLFGKPYNDGDPAVNPGVPLKLTMDVTDEKQRRSSVAKVYEQIERDLLTGEELMDANRHRKLTSRMDRLAAKALLSRMYLYMGQWDRTIEYASLVIDEKPDLYDLKTIAHMSDIGGGEQLGVYGENSPVEIIWSRRGDQSVLGNSNIPLNPYGPSEDIIQSFVPQDNDAEDLRLKFYMWPRPYWNPITYEIEYHYKAFMKDNHISDGIRVAEMYMNRAEAYIMKYLASGDDGFRTAALADINFVREHRFATTDDRPYVEIDMADGNALLEFYRSERRREMCGESNHRWFDLRRWGQPEIKHVYFVNKGEETTYTLPEGDPRYVLPIPQFARDRNPNLDRN